LAEAFGWKKAGNCESRELDVWPDGSFAFPLDQKALDVSWLPELPFLTKSGVESVITRYPSLASEFTADGDDDTCSEWSLDADSVCHRDIDH